MAAKFIDLTSVEQFDTLIENSFERPVAVLKHSATCGISANVYYDLQGIEAEINVLTVQTHRSLSDLIAERLGHRHHSPQAFVIRDGKTVYHATHYGVNASEIEEKLAISEIADMQTAGPKS